jgi:hypothetical protein
MDDEETTSQLDSFGQDHFLASSPKGHSWIICITYLAEFIWFRYSPLNNINLPYMYYHFQITMYKSFRNLQFACKIALTSNYQLHNASKRSEGQSEEMFFSSFEQIVQSQATIYLQD